MKLPEKLRRILRSPGKYARSVWRWKRLIFNDAPPIFANAKPKSGSHLLLQVMKGLCEIAPYAYVAADPIRTIRADGGRRSDRKVLAELKAIRQGVIGWGYVDATPKNVAFLCQPGRVNYFIYRDPRDMLVSHVFFATDMHTGHGMHDFYQKLPNFNDRLKVAICGIKKDGLFMVDVRERYKGVFEWLDQPATMCIRFEDLVDEREVTLGRMLDQIEKTGFRIPTQRNDALSILVDAIQPSKSRTFRSGKTGGWKEQFSNENKALFKEVAGDLLVRLGYEKNNDW
jgi:hypothetical protein